MLNEHFVLRLSEREVVALKRGLERFMNSPDLPMVQAADIPVLRSVFVRLELLPVLDPLPEVKNDRSNNFDRII